MTGTKQLLLDVVEITMNGAQDTLTVYANIYDNSLSRKWLQSLDQLLEQEYHLEKNYCFFGFADGPRNGPYLLAQINLSITAINESGLGYHINDHFDISNSVDELGGVNHAHFNQLHSYFEDLQGVSGAMSPFYKQANAVTRWHIRQLNLLCHEFESWVLSWRKKHTAPEWQRPSQLMCWLNAPRFVLEESDYDLFGIDSMNRPLGGVFVGVNKAIGKHHWEVFVDEAQYDPEFIADNLVTTSLRSQTEATGDFDIEWANNPANYAWQKQHLTDFRTWLIRNGLDPEDKTLTIGHPQIGQVDLMRSFGTEDYQEIWAQLQSHLNVVKIKTSNQICDYNYNWTDENYSELQIKEIK